MVIGFVTVLLPPFLITNYPFQNYCLMCKLFSHYPLDTEVQVIDENSGLHNKIFPIVGIIKVTSITRSFSKTIYYYEIESDNIRHALPFNKFKLHKLSKHSKRIATLLYLLYIGLGCLLLFGFLLLWF